MLKTLLFVCLSRRALSRYFLVYWLGLCGVTTVGLGFPIVAAAAPARVATVVLLLHGTNSDATTWNDLVQQVYRTGCPVLRLGVAVSDASRCYRYQFADRTVDGVLWNNGDGATISQLRDEVRATIRKITRRVTPRNLILVGHSRGGLAARAYLQNLPSATPFKIGLVTLATPHQGTPFGRVSVFMRDQGASPDDVINDLRFIFSPSVATLATEHDESGNPVRTPTSEAIYKLNDDIATLTTNAGGVGYLQTGGLHLGERAYQDFDILRGVGATVLDFLSPGSFDRLMRFVLANTVPVRARPVLPDTWSCRGAAFEAHPWACDGDGIVPAISQKIDAIPGYVPGARAPHHVELQKIPHTQQTGRSTEIRQLVRMVRQDLNS